MVTLTANNLERRRIQISGQVQGVGFRPYIHRLARKLGLSGWVCNAGSNVTLEIQGSQITEFLTCLKLDPPPLSNITTFEVVAIAILPEESQFIILESHQATINTLLAQDSAICLDCITELFDNNSRYCGYPFLNCTNCGPRLSITKKLPYDRKNTSMHSFPLCSSCYQDYHDINHRRYHAQPTACAECGPRHSISIKEIAQSIRAGKIVALKGIGGYQLICNAFDEMAVSELRKRKNREAKPFALMVLNTATAQEMVECNNDAITLLESSSRPILLLPRKMAGVLLPINIAPGLSNLGIMLPNSPLHYLLFHALSSTKSTSWLNEYQPLAFVVTSANLPGEPILINDSEARKNLSSIADVIVSHNRDITNRLDDSIITFINKKPCFIRRARGYVPISIKLPYAIPPVLSVGGFLKNTICVTKGDQAFLSQHIGDLNNTATIDFFNETVDSLLKLLDVSPICIAHDLHSDFYSSFFANEYNLPTIAVQHHHAHLAAVMAEYHLLDPVLGLALDGHGLGLGGELWGGELFVLQEKTFQRLAHLSPLPMPGGEKATREPWRMAASAMHCLNRTEEISNRFAEKHPTDLIIQMLEKKVNVPLTSSCGRLFDAAAGILGIIHKSRYEAEAAMLLESLVTENTVLSGGWTIDNDQLNMLPTLDKLLDLTPMAGASLFHGTLIAALSEWLIDWSKKTQLNSIVLSGGCFLNRILTEGLMANLSKANLNIYLPRLAPPNDGGISLGQAWLGGLNLK